MKLRIDDIVVRNRIRRNLGDISSLMESMQRHGLLHPVVVNGSYELIAGHRRLEAAKRLGWTTIEADVMSDIDEIERVELEIDENVHRKSLTPDELADGYERLQRMKNPGFFVKLWRRIAAFFRKIFGKKSE